MILSRLDISENIYQRIAYTYDISMGYFSPYHSRYDISMNLMQSEFATWDIKDRVFSIKTCHIYGTIVDATLEPLINASVYIYINKTIAPIIISEKTEIIYTDIDGVFSIDIPVGTEINIVVPSAAFQQIIRVPDTITLEVENVTNS